MNFTQSKRSFSTATIVQLYPCLAWVVWAKVDRRWSWPIRLSPSIRQYSVFWVQAEKLLTFEEDMLHIGKKLGIPGIDDPKADVQNLGEAATSELT
jgi:hypothetical protein